MTDTINISLIQTNKKFNLTTLYNETKHTENLMYNDQSPFSLNTSECKYFTSVEFSKYVKPETVSLSMFCVNCRSLEAHWDTLQELLLTMSSNGLTLDFIGLTEIFKIQDVLHYKINGYHNLLFNTRLDADDGHGGIGLYISETFTYSKREDLSIFIPHVFESIFFELQAAKRKPIIVGVIYRPNSHPRADLDFFYKDSIIYSEQNIK